MGRGKIEERIEVTGGEQAKQQLDQVSGATGRVGQEAEESGTKAGLLGRAFGSLSGSVTSLVAGMIGIPALLGAINRAWTVWLDNMRETSQRVNEVAKSIEAFVALQPGGTKGERAREVTALGARYSPEAFKAAPGVVQALQSAAAMVAPEGTPEAETYRQGLVAAETVFKASLVGIPIERGLELEVLGASQGQAPGQALQRAFVAGQASARDPMTLAAAAEGLTRFEDKDFGFAVASILAGALPAAKLPTFLTAAGIGLDPGSTLKGFYGQTGVLGGTHRQRLQALVEAGLDTPGKLAAEGLGEQRQQQALAILVSNVAGVDRNTALIREQAREGIFGEFRTAMEAELPMLRREREADVLAAKARLAQVSGPAAAQAQKLELEERATALAFREIGIEQYGPWDVIDAEGRTSRTRAVLGRMAIARRENLARYAARLGGGAGGGAGNVTINNYHGPVNNLPDPALQPDERSVVVSTE